VPEPAGGFYAEVGTRVRDARKAVGLTQAGLADATSLTRASVANIEAGRQKLLVHNLVSIARATHTEPQALLPGGPPERVDAALLARRELGASQADWVSAILEQASERDRTSGRRKS